MRLAEPACRQGGVVFSQLCCWNFRDLVAALREKNKKQTDLWLKILNVKGQCNTLVWEHSLFAAAACLGVQLVAGVACPGAL